MPGDLVAHYQAVAAEADLDPVLRDVRDRPVSRDDIFADRNRGVRPVRDDPAFLIEGDRISGDCAGRARAIAKRVIIHRNAVLRAVKRLLANIMDITVGDIHRCWRRHEPDGRGDCRRGYFGSNDRRKRLQYRHLLRTGKPAEPSKTAKSSVPTTFVSLPPKPVGLHIVPPAALA